MFAASCGPPPVRADRVFVGRFLTLDAARPEVEALAVAGERIVAAGSEAEMERVVPGVPRVRFDGAAIPGFADAHVHALAYGEQLEILNLRGLSKGEIVERVAARARALPAGTWIEGRGWDQGFWTPVAFPTAADLDPVSKSHPVILTRIDGHSIWVNSEAMRVAGVSRATRDPRGGYLMRQGDQPTGVLVDAATSLVEDAAPDPSRARLKARLKAAMEQYVRLGLTSVHDAGVGSEGIELYRELQQEGALPLRVYVMASGSDATAARLLETDPDVSSRDHRLVLRSFKLMLDGALGSRGAQLAAPYADAPDQRGLELMSDDALGAFVRKAAARGWQVNAHAIGDLAVTRILDAFQRHAGPDLAARRFRVEHASVIAGKDVPRFAALGVIASMQPNFVGEYSRWAADRLGPVRVERVMPVRDLLASGAILAAGSDYPAADSPDPLVTLYGLVTRKGARGTPDGGWIPGQTVDVDAALRAMTWAPAYAAFEEADLGALTTGRLADFTVVSADPRTTPADQLKDISVVMTVVGGARVFEADQFHTATGSGR
jgi:predicted amidohydrolase YtcJ